ncbi:MAG: 3-dehydroquinate synthase, partial [Deltaproteobacteria bacterium]|nr:3-dehydroquinate synthase [Deltaproteobacteria bacterium]
METVEVDLGERSYPIFIGNGTLNKIGKTLEGYTNSRTLAIVTNPTVSDLYLEEVKGSFEKSKFT